ncbi:MAG: PD-(D/E)XK nuclease family protein [Clostridia bacterium]|nr:PD-(D/E)XK nuclease family protein [Clostridia bacterium]
MVKLYLGAYGHGKSTRIIEDIKKDYEKLKKGGIFDESGEQKARSILIVPEQQTLVSERQLVSTLPPSAQLFVEATNLTRLADSVFRKTGGLKYNYITKSAQNLIMYRVICELRKELKPYYDIQVGREKNYIGMFSLAIGELKSYSITTPILEAALTKLEKDNVKNAELLCEKLKPYYNIPTGYEKGYIGRLSLMIEELKSLNPTVSIPKDVHTEIEAMGLKNTELLCNKLKAIIIVWKLYDELVKDKYDDPYEVLTMLAEKLGMEENNYLKGCNVYIDSFYGFTKSQLDVVARIIEKADNVTIALDCPKDANENTLQYKKIVDTKNKILKICQKLKKKTEELSFDVDYKHKEKEELKYVCENLWSFSAEPIVSKGEVTLAKAEDEFAECEYVCTRIMEIITGSKGKTKYGEIAIIARNSSTYQGIIDFCLKKYNIPHYISTPSKLSSQPLIKMIFSALNAINGMRAEDIITYAKCGYTDIDDNDLYSLESYIYKWNIYGDKFNNDDYWSANPDGYVERPNAEQENERKRILEARKKITDMLDILYKPFSQGKCVHDCVLAVFEFLEKHNIRPKLIKEIEKSSNEDAQEISQICDALNNALECINSICGDISTDVRTFSALLNFAMMDVKIGTIPPMEDGVIIADASLVRAKNIKHVFVLGANEGVFPAVVNDDSFFTDSDKVELETVEINLTKEVKELSNGEKVFLSAKTQERRDDELLFFKNSIAVASESATVTCLKKDINGSLKKESSGFSRIANLLSIEKPFDISDLKPIDKIYTKEIANDFFGVTRGELKGAIKTLCKPKLNATGFKNENDKVSKQTVKDIFGTKLYLSKSSMETFHKCHLDYYCSYELDLKSSERITFAHDKIGNLIHSVFEHFLKLDAKERKTYTKEKISKTVTELTDDYTAKVCGSRALSNKMKHFFERLKATMCIFVEELLEEQKCGKFTNAYNELKINGDGNFTPKPTVLKIDKQKSITLTGRADRVDIFREGGKTYVRILDYKTGSTEFKIKKLKNGLDMQMLIYLMALCNMDKCTFKNKLLSKSTSELVPVGIRYLTYNINKTKGETEVDINSADAPQIEENITKSKIIRTGMEIEDPLIKSANKKFDLKKNSMGDFKNFDEVFELVKAKILEIGTEMLSGNASASPLEGESPCDFCNNGAVCRRRKKSVRFD